MIGCRACLQTGRAIARILRLQAGRAIAGVHARHGFPDYVLRLLVVAQTEIDRVPQLAVRGPFSEFDLCDQRRLHPVRPLVGFWLLEKRTHFRLERLQQLHQPRELRFVEAGSRVADVDEPSAWLLIDAKQQRPEV